MSTQQPPPPPTTAPSLVDTLFQRTLDDVIKSLRSLPSSSSEPPTLSRFLSEIRREILSPDLATKSTALHKLTYLSSLHFVPFSFALFPSLQLLPSPPHSRIAYLFASLHFHSSSTDLLPLATHQLHKHISTPNSPFASPALHLLALSDSLDLARHLSPDLLPLLNSTTNSPLRPKAVATALRILSIYPDAAPVLFKPLVACISSPDRRTSSAALGAFCQLALTSPDPTVYLSLAPDFFRVLVDRSSGNNWALIKVLKIFAKLAPLEPRLASRIVDPVCDLMNESRAKSVVFECVRTVLCSLAGYDQAVKIAVEKVKEFLGAEDDPNLRYLGLLALGMLGSGHGWAMEENREAVVRSLTDADCNIRREALRLLMGMVNEENVVEVSDLLVKFALKSDPEFANEILDAVLGVCGRNVYELVVDFDWYVSVLGNMARNPHCGKGEEIGRQLVDIALRVKDARPELVSVARELLIDPALLGNPFLYDVLSAAAWISGEYVEFCRNLQEIVEALLQPRTSLLPSVVRAVYIQSVFKVITFVVVTFIEQIEAEQSVLADNSVSEGLEHEFSHGSAVNTLVSDGTKDGMVAGATDGVVLHSSASMEKGEFFSGENVLRILSFIERAVGLLYESDEVEVQERSRNVLGLIHILQQSRIWNIEKEYSLVKDENIVEIVDLLREAFSDELGPVSTNAQKRVPVPDGLVLNETLADLATFLDDIDGVPSTSISFSLRHQHAKETKNDSAVTAETSLLSEHRKRHGLYYLGSDKDEVEWDDYPRANDPLLPVSQEDTSGSLMKLAKQSIAPRKAKPTKPRPVVVKLDDGEAVSSSGLPGVKETKDDLLSGAIRDVLIPNEHKQSFRQEELPENVSRRSAEDISKSVSKSKEISSLDDTEQGSSSSRLNKHRRHRKERNINLGTAEEEDKSHRTRSSNNHGKHKHKQRAEASVNVVPQAPVIQDFLL